MVGTLTTLLGSKLRARVLGWLFSHSDERYYVRQLTALLGEDSTNVSRELARLEQAGIVISTKEGKQKYYQVNRQSPIFDELRGLIIKTVGISQQLVTALEVLEDRIRIAFIYGSFARGEETSSSDIDLLVIGELGLRDVVRALSGLQRTLGREINPTVYSPGEYRMKLDAGQHFLTALQEEPKIFLIGNEDELRRLG